MPDWARALEGQSYMRPDARAGDIHAWNFFNFDIAQQARVYLALDENLTTPPLWMQVGKWRLEDFRLQASDGVERICYSHFFPAGRVDLGSNRDASLPLGLKMYGIIVAHENVELTRTGNWALFP